jgi:hypothetical protein
MNLTSINQPLGQGLTPLSLRVALVLCLASSLLSAATIDDLQFTLINGDTEYAVSAKYPETIQGVVTVPATYNGKPVTHVKLNGFRGSATSSYITSVVLPDSITSIGNSAFNYCTSLTSIVLPDSITSIGEHAFSYCTALTSVVLPESITTIEFSTFYRCTALTSIEFPDSITSIEEWSFYYCNALTSIELPSSLTSIGPNAFRYCYNLASIAFLGAAPTLGENAFSGTGRDTGGFTITIYDTHEASYDSLRSLYTFNVVPEPVIEPVVYYAQIDYNPSSSYLSITTESDPETVPLDLQHKADLQSAWTIINTGDYEKVTDTNSNSVTRNIPIDPTTKPSGFYRLSAEQEL